jgi:hypothetical protein
LHGGQTYALPAFTSEEWLHPFRESDVGLLPWTFFKNSSPKDVHRFQLKVGGLSQGKSLVYIGLNPQGRFTEIGGITTYKVTAAMLYHDIATANGSCGSITVEAHNGTFYIVAIHSGTTNASTHPNHGYLFHLKN